MAFSPFRAIGQGIKWFWNAVDASRRFLINLIFLLLVIFLLNAMFSSDKVKIDDRTALILNFKGQIVEQHAGSASDAFLAEVQGENKRSTQLRDILTVLDAASRDPKITSAVLMLDGMQGAGLAMLREVAGGIERFKASGKKVIAWGSSFDQRQYYLASHANEVYMHPMGNVMLSGFGGYRNYYKDALDKIGITVNVLKVGTFKSFAEPYIANGPSPASSEADAFLYNAMWKLYTDGVEQARKLPAGTVMNSINNLPDMLKAANGSVAQFAVNAKLIDGLKSRDDLRQMMLGMGAKDAQTKSFKQINFDDYLQMQSHFGFGPNIAVIVAEGEISEGNASPGAIGGLSTANLVRKAREDDQVKAVVVRVDSPGGSAFGSELIRQELELTRKAGKPVVISMGNVAASGGYWISMSSDEVIADAATITGSIGVFAIFPTADKVMDKIGVHTAGTTTTWMSDSFNPLRPMNPKFGEVIQLGINNIYSEFTTKAAAARKTTPQKIDEVAQGRVWTGEQAKERGLVDRVGSFKDALKSAATLAKLGSDYRVTYIEREPSKFDRFFSMFEDGAAKAAARAINDQFKVAVAPSGIPPAAATEMIKDLAWLADLRKENRSYMVMAHCMCTLP
ncbi:signal peptide peptidase SppA [Undibacterium seohonense]|jgi:protease-4|uniref:Signal peptide peptidase SppA n=1 Tax=Undibacterium seohonense TaxID=1344950 RepID=A0ABR6X980_9BURK|nr:signal peptide peptidase SppA [Undibacterium seohonense]MBC3809396.1 signal peptide peptidase SppA [Undibacterium seohonense]